MSLRRERPEVTEWPKHNMLWNHMALGSNSSLIFFN